MNLQDRIWKLYKASLARRNKKKNPHFPEGRRLKTGSDISCVVQHMYIKPQSQTLLVEYQLW